MNPPCKGCTPETGRSDTCHPTCQKYLDWCAENKKKQIYIKDESSERVKDELK